MAFLSCAAYLLHSLSFLVSLLPLSLCLSVSHLSLPIPQPWKSSNPSELLHIKRRGNQEEEVGEHFSLWLIAGYYLIVYGFMWVCSCVYMGVYVYVVFICVSMSVWVDVYVDPIHVCMYMWVCMLGMGMILTSGELVTVVTA